MDPPLNIQQVAVIARPKPDGPYCQMASALQTCRCPRTIIHPCLAALNAFADDKHQVPILQEIAFAAECQIDNNDFVQTSKQQYPTGGKTAVENQFPYIAACLFSAIAFCLDQGHAIYHCSVEKPRCFYKGKLDIRHKRVGRPTNVSVIDITDPRNPRYCFLNMDSKCIWCALRDYDPDGINNQDRQGELAPWTMPAYTPCSGESLSCRMLYDLYHNVTGFERDRKDLNALEALKAYPLIDVAALASCWPSPMWNLSQQETTGLSQLSISVHPRAQKSQVKSLRKLTEHKILDAIVSGVLDDLNLLDNALQIPGFPKDFLDTCISRADLLAASDNQNLIAKLLARLLEGLAHVNLYPFRKLPIETLREILHSDNLNDMKSLNISGLFVGSSKDIIPIFNAIPRQLECVYLLQPPGPANRLKDKEAAIMVNLSDFIMRKGDEILEDGKKILTSANLATALDSLSYFDGLTRDRRALARLRWRIDGWW
ncbi:hypothetical protein J7T55_004595 [Diaporthe amygdali]|uniref:uncharacterized protein n=1 Tax=Phomopsis amygdali TaxID=1214568 RepID=UPI0022FE3FFD|nr:uncharacterized protein J7T55_004595 [Diaporthe amygdali]KAJ0114853.1 hypothetical protein J7T55_004595 [Diaporthe amygdali]